MDGRNAFGDVGVVIKRSYTPALAAYPIALLSSLFIAGCASSPVYVSDCSLQRIEGDEPLLRARLSNRGGKTITQVYVMLATSTNAHLGYWVTAGLSPRMETMRSSARGENTYPAQSIPIHLGSVTECRVQSANFDDGTHWSEAPDM